MIAIFKHMKKREVIMIALSFIFVCGQVYLDLKIPDFINQITVLVSSADNNFNQAMTIGIQMLLCLIASVILSIITGYLIARASSGFTFTLREDLFHKVLEFSDEEINKFSIPSLITRTTNDITQIQILISMGLQIAVKAPVTAIWAICKIIGKNWQLTLLTAAFIVFVCVSVLIVMVLVMPKFRIIQKLTDKINLIVRENLKGINVVHAYNAQEFQNIKFEKTNDDITKTQLFNQRIFSVLLPVVEISSTCLWFCIYWLGAILISQMEIGLRVSFFGDIVAFAMYANYILASFMMMIMIFMMLPPAIASGERIKAVLESGIKIHEGKEENTNNESTLLEFRDVSFKYPNTKKHMIKNINFKINNGENIAIIGPTGSGKTTLVNLIMRFYDVSKGKILLCGKDISSYTFNTLYNKVHMATQKPVIFYGTIKDNICFGDVNNGISGESIDKALSVSQSLEFVNNLKDGQNTIISQGGKDISGGQKQRISIARAIAKNPEILILDDTFSALDYKTDSNLRRDLSIHLPNTTVIMVAHRIGTIKNADKILVLNNGNLVGCGKHEELLKNCKDYQQIAKSQLMEE